MFSLRSYFKELFGKLFESDFDFKNVNNISNYIFVDLRSLDDFFKSHVNLKGRTFTVNVPFESLFNWMSIKDKFRLARDKIIVLYGVNLKRLLIARRYLYKKGFRVKILRNYFKYLK